jgi:hypothetical protein
LQRVELGGAVNAVLHGTATQGDLGVFDQGVDWRSWLAAEEPEVVS